MLDSGGWDNGYEPYNAIKKSLMVYWGGCGGVQIECLEELLVANILRF